jgi:type I restriction enzyme S subunit
MTPKTKNNWQTKKFIDCLETIRYTSKIHKKDFLKFGDFPIISQEEAFTNGFWNKKDDVFKISTPIIVFGDHTQVLKYVDFNFVLGADGVKILCPKKFLYPKYLYYFLQNIGLKNLGYARHYRLLKEIDITFPETTEGQQRIVEILDEVFEGVDKAKENTEKNLQNARELFESYLYNVFANPNKEWEEKRLEEILQKTETINPTQNPNKEFIYIDVSSVNNKSFTIENTTLLKGINAPSRARKLIKNGDVIFATIRPTLRRIAIIPKEYDSQICSTGYFVFRGKGQVHNKLLFYFLLTNSFNEKMKKLQKGASYPAVTDKEIKEQVIAFPKSLLEQHNIIDKLDSLAEETKKLENIYKQKLANLEELKKSVLKKAFSGEL